MYSTATDCHDETERESVIRLEIRMVYRYRTDKDKDRRRKTKEQTVLLLLQLSLLIYYIVLVWILAVMLHACWLPSSTFYRTMYYSIVYLYSIRDGARRKKVGSGT